MSSKKFPGVDEFTSERIRRDVKEQHPEKQTLAGEFSLVNEIRTIQARDAIKVVEDIKGERATDGEAMASMLYKRAQAHARRDHLGDYHSGLSAADAEALLRQIGFKQAYRKEKRFGTHQAWADPLTGILVAGEFGERRTALTCYLQFSPNLPSMTEKEESEWNLLVARSFGGYAGYSWFNPKRPALHHGELHYARSYPDVDEVSRKAWQEDYRAVPASILAERGQWVMVADGQPEAGLHALMATLHRRDVRFCVPWEAAQMQEFTYQKVFDCEEGEVEAMFEVSPSWFKEIYRKSFARVVEDLQLKSAPKP
ncbi:hypothetical protein [Rhizobium sp. MHM7A]|uniref:hypothetical protein n=1 Tax=Rhizobium sp. MHM7A TaxID=2583233 RepID=UPI001105E78D|nr:hypothetical protein [Rhizobium sp. MHM7A]TLX16205.1 hypothetical protein FFR93_02440 [Rhizobium sp. MHM7A]